MRLLLAEDDAILGRATCRGLMQGGYAVDWVTTGNQALNALRLHAYDCVLLDLGLPEIGGVDCLRNIRAGRSMVPVIVLTARNGVGDRIDLLDLGADDYLVKPFDLDEMTARVRAVVRRAQSRNPDQAMEHGCLKLLPLNRTALWHDNVIQLTSKEFWVLEVLVRHRDRPVSRRQLEEALYGWDEDIGSNAIEVHIHHLRRKLHPRIVVTVRGVGYQIAEAEAMARHMVERESTGADQPPGFA